MKSIIRRGHVYWQFFVSHKLCYLLSERLTTTSRQGENHSHACQHETKRECVQGFTSQGFTSHDTVICTTFTVSRNQIRIIKENLMCKNISAKMMKCCIKSARSTPSSTELKEFRTTGTPCLIVEPACGILNHDFHMSLNRSLGGRALQ